MTWILKWQQHLVIQLFLLAVTVTSTANQNSSCPHGCVCEETAISCRGGNLSSLPVTPHPSNIIKLVVSGQHSITKIRKELHSYAAIQLLNLSANNISTISPGAFIKQARLTTLILRRNHLQRLDKETFIGLGHLENLDLGYNGLTVLQNHTFAELGSLHHLDFIKNNISVIEKNAFNGLKSLVVLNLTRNHLKTLQPFGFRELSSLKILVLDDNFIEELPRFAFSGLVSLKILRLNGNRLIRILPMAFALENRNSSTVEQLYLKGTSLTEFPEKAFEQLHHLKILDLSQSKIKMLLNGSFDKLIHLRRIVLVGMDSLTEIGNHTFSWLFKLEELIVKNNPMLQTLGSTAMPSLYGNMRLVDFSFNSIKVFHKNMVAWDSDVIVDLTHNPIVCDCQSVWMLQTLPNATNNITRRNSANLSCAAPQILAGRNILSLPVSAFSCDVTVFDRAEVFNRVKTAAIAAAVTSILLITILIVIKFRSRLHSFIRRQYRYRSYKNNGMFTVDKNGNSNEDGVSMDVVYTYTDTPQR